MVGRSSLIETKAKPFLCNSCVIENAGGGCACRRKVPCKTGNRSHGIPHYNRRPQLRGVVPPPRLPTSPLLVRCWICTGIEVSTYFVRIVRADSLNQEWPTCGRQGKCGARPSEWCQ